MSAAAPAPAASAAAAAPAAGGGLEAKSASPFAAVPTAPMDPILGTKILFRQDGDARKINLGIGAFRDNNGKPVVLRAVRRAEKILAADDSLDHEYLPIEGHAGFRKVAAELIFGHGATVLKEGRVATLQSLSGTGALRVAAAFIARFLPRATVYISSPTWGNHMAVFREAGVPFKKYRYWHAATRGLDIDGLLADLNAAPAGSVVLLHACAHNPTGVDPTREQWARIADVVAARGLVPFFDTAYQGFATGSLSGDAAAIRLFMDERRLTGFVAQSFAKNFGLYNERVGTVNFVCGSADEAAAVLSQAKLVVRPMYSNPPVHGARIVHTVLSSAEMYRDWEEEMVGMSKRIDEMRKLLRGELESIGTPGKWNHITDQIGMFTFTGLSPEQCEELIKKHHVYLLKNGRISMAGVNTGNVKYLAQAIDTVVREVKPAAKSAL